MGAQLVLLQQQKTQYTHPFPPPHMYAPPGYPMSYPFPPQTLRKSGQPQPSNHSKYFSPTFRKLYNIDQKIATDGYIYCIILRGMYGLKQAAILAYRQLVDHLRKYGYYPCKGTTGLWRHQTLPTKFAKCVDDFMVKYFNKKHAAHLTQALQDKYEITQDWSGENFCGLQFKWNYEKRYVDMSMPKYVSKTIIKFNHRLLKRPQHVPYKWSVPPYGRARCRWCSLARR